MVQKYFAYPVILDDRNHQPGEYLVTFPDLPEISIVGTGIADSLAKATELLTQTLDNIKDLLPSPSHLKTVASKHPDTLVSYILISLEVPEEMKMSPPTKIPVSESVKKPTVKEKPAFTPVSGVEIGSTLTKSWEDKIGF